MSFRRIAENRIREALESGAFDNLPGSGRPIDLEEYFQTPEDLRLAHSVLKAAHCRPEEVELLAEIAKLGERIAVAPTDAERRESERRRRDLRLRLDLLLERRRTKRR